MKFSLRLQLQISLLIWNLSENNTDFNYEKTQKNNYQFFFDNSHK